ncbi:universal stress protein [Cecembia calidifontis]|jgi:nucleotide-binding universal stress UspA family protein|uniref:Nucleotide-binding universal stress UspA family protein n=1 Tax=Cecembia calidifontis TaxID=1187080 RepID=A0A4Q7PAL3_9BACT|nr:universal stress protein [Cecembia calidifontis]RZS97225.1 nucleotide-binding universal stress UspA family protein [Cecembia calidifontis]
MKNTSSEKPKIIVLADFSDYTKKVLQVAKQWASSSGLEIKVFNELDFQVPTLAGNELRLKMKYGQIHEINRTWLDLKKTIFGEQTKVDFEILEVPLIEFLKKEKQYESSFILMGLKGGGLLKKVFLGSLVTEVIERLNHVTMAIPKNIQNFEPNKIIISVHPKYKFNLNALEYLLSFLPRSVTTLQWISIAMEKDNVDDLNDYLDALTQKIKTGLKIETAVFSGEDVLQQVKSFITDNNKEILVIQRGSRTFKDKLFRKFLVNDLVYDGSVPLIVLPL